MSHIDNLINKLCPNGVAYAGVMEIADYVRGVTYNKSDEQADGPVQVLRANNITLASNTLNFDDIRRVAASVRARENQRLLRGDVLICAGSGSRAHIGKVAYIDCNLDQTFGGFMAVLRSHERINSRYLFHILTGGRFTRYLEGALSTTTINNLNASIMKGFRIPVPPLEVQREVVRILDQFTQLEAELEAELEARRRQYEHYRRASLTPRDNWTEIELGKLAIIKTGKPVSKRAIQDNPGRYPVINSGRDPLGYIDLYNTNNDPVGITSRGAGVGSVTWCDGKYFRGNLNYSVTIRDPELADTRFIYHSLQFLQPQIQSLCSFQGIPALNKTNLEKLAVPLPAMDAQRQVVGMLDAFDALVNDLSSGLPAELRARRKQYEYYRDRLLTFKELPA